MSELTLFLIRVGLPGDPLDLRALRDLGDPLRHVRCPRARDRPRRRTRPDVARAAKANKKPRRGAPTHLLVVEGDNPGTRAELADAPLLIGRGSDAAIKLDDDYVSTRHARIAASGDEWFVEDLGSTNGTYVGPVRITQPTTIGLGIQVRVGKTILELRK